MPWKAVRTQAVRAVPTFLLRPAARSPRRTTARCARRRSAACQGRGRSGRRREVDALGLQEPRDLVVEVDARARGDGAVGEAVVVDQLAAARVEGR